jgi:predicted small metal-binding protein
LLPLSTVAVEVTHGKLLRCDCGFEVDADDEADLVARVQRHALQAHGMRLSPEEVLQLAYRAEPGEATWQERFEEGSHDNAS